MWGLDWDVHRAQARSPPPGPASPLDSGDSHTSQHQLLRLAGESAAPGRALGSLRGPLLSSWRSDLTAYREAGAE